MAFNRRTLTAAPSRGPLETEPIGIGVIDPSQDWGGFPQIPPPGRGAPELSTSGVLTPPAGGQLVHAQLPHAWRDPGYDDAPYYGGKVLFPSPVSFDPEERTAAPVSLRTDWRRPKLIAPAERTP